MPKIAAWNGLNIEYHLQPPAECEMRQPYHTICIMLSGCQLERRVDSGEPLPASSEYGGGFGCNGEDIAPTLTWKHVPAQTSSFALVMNDVDAAVAGGFHHWIVYNIPATARTLQGNAPSTQGTNSLNIRTYFGQCPPATAQDQVQKELESLPLYPYMEVVITPLSRM